MQKKQQEPKTAIWWVTNDQRIHDNPILNDINREYDRLIPVFILNPKLFKPKQLGFHRFGPYRYQFLLESLQNLRNNLEELGSGIALFYGDPIHILQTLSNTYEVDAIYTQYSTATEEKKLQRELEKSPSITVKCVESKALYEFDDLPFSTSELPDVFTQFRKIVEKFSMVKPLEKEIKSLPKFPINEGGELPSTHQLFDFNDLPKEDPRAVMQFKGGESAAKDRLQNYIWKSKAVATYKETRNGLIGADYSTKFSPYLALGNLSPKFIEREVRRYEMKHSENESTYWVIFELLWRDYFYFIGEKYGAKCFQRLGLKQEGIQGSHHQSRFEKWRLGDTDDPFVNANMKELLNTGFMSNRGRQNVASYLVKDLGIDWRWGAKWFEYQLIDYDVNSNYGNWMYIAGLGNDPRPHRYFDTKKQASIYDPKAEFQQLWNSTQVPSKN